MEGYDLPTKAEQRQVYHKAMLACYTKCACTGQTSTKLVQKYSYKAWTETLEFDFDCKQVKQRMSNFLRRGDNPINAFGPDLGDAVELRAQRPPPSPVRPLPRQVDEVYLWPIDDWHGWDTIQSEPSRRFPSSESFSISTRPVSFIV